MTTRPVAPPDRLAPALTRWRVMAWIVGVMLLILTFVAIPLRYVFHEPVVSETISPIHGFLYIVYLIATFDLAQKAGWKPKKMIGVMLAGTVPFLSFVIEKRISAGVRHLLGSGQPGSSKPGSSQPGSSKRAS